MTEILNPTRSELVLKPFSSRTAFLRHSGIFSLKKGTQSSSKIYYHASPRLTLSKLRNFALTLKEFWITLAFFYALIEQESCNRVGS